MPYPCEPCDCELPGAYCCGIPGILAAMADGRVAPGAAVERCDQCKRYASDAAALAWLRELGLADAAESRSFTVHYYTLVRVKFPGVVANNPRSAARRVLDRFDWDVHGAGAEPADELTELLVDIDGNTGSKRSRRFTQTLEETDV